VRRFEIAGSMIVSAAVLLYASTMLGAQVQPAPSVPLHLSDGTVVSPLSFRGKVLLIDFWASWCAPCKVSFPAVDALFQRYREEGLLVIGVNTDKQARDADAFLSKYPHVMPIAFDPRGSSAKIFDVRAMPTSFLIDRSGNIRFRHAGYSTKVLESYEREITALLGEH